MRINAVLLLEGFLVAFILGAELNAKTPTALVELKEGATELDAATAVAEDDAGRRGRRGRRSHLQTTGSFAVSGSNRAGNDELEEQAAIRLGESAASDVLVIKNPRGRAVCPTGRECHLECKGDKYNWACDDLKGGSGWFSKITCDGYSCYNARFPSCPTGKRCELKCIGRNGACRIYDGCRGELLCSSLKKFHIAEARTIDIFNEAGLSASALPKVEGLPRTMAAARIVGVNGYAWPPEACKDQHIGGNRQQWWYCPMTQKCALSFRDCDMSVKMRALGPSQVQDPTKILEHPISVRTRPATATISGHPAPGQQCTINTCAGAAVSICEVHIKVIMDAQAGYQAKSMKQIGGLLSIAGSMIFPKSSLPSQRTQFIFTIAEDLWPNFCTYTLSPLVMQDNSVQAVPIELCDDGKATIKLPEGVSASKGTLGMNINYARLEVKGATKIQPSGDWKKAPGSEPNFIALDMEQGSKLCMLGGTLTRTWSNGQSSVITTLPAECTQDYLKDGFETVGNVKVDGELQQIQKGNTIPFKLSLQGSKLTLRTTRTDLAGKKVTVSLDGISLASGGQLAKCSSQEGLGEPTDPAPVTIPSGSSAQVTPIAPGMLKDSLMTDLNTILKQPVDQNVHVRANPEHNPEATDLLLLDLASNITQDANPKHIEVEENAYKSGFSAGYKTAIDTKAKYTHRIARLNSDPGSQCGQQQAILQSKFKAKVSGMESEHAAKTKELETKISETKTNLESKFKAKVTRMESETKELKKKVSTLSAQASEQNKHETHAAQLEEQRAALEAKFKTEIEMASAKAADYEMKATELTSTTKELRTKVSAAHSKEKEAAAKINHLKQAVASKPAQTSSASNPHDSTEVAKEAKKVSSQMEGCTLVGDNAVNTTGFSIINKHNLAVMGRDIDSRTCVLRGVVKFTSDGSTAVAWLDPNYRDPDIDMPLCFPVSGTMQFFASIVNPKDTSEIERTVGLQIEPHGRMVIIGRQPLDAMVRLDNILYHPLMKFNEAPQTCAPYCFPTSKLGQEGFAVSGCVKYCTPTQYVRQSDTSLKAIPSPCRCTMLKRLDCFKRNGQADIVCGQFKRLMETSDAKGNPTEKCDRICAGQLVAF